MKDVNTCGVVLVVSLCKGVCIFRGRSESSSLEDPAAWILPYHPTAICPPPGPHAPTGISCIIHTAHTPRHTHAHTAATSHTMYPVWTEMLQYCCQSSFVFSCLCKADFAGIPVCLFFSFCTVPAWWARAIKHRSFVCCRFSLAPCCASTTCFFHILCSFLSVSLELLDKDKGKELIRQQHWTGLAPSQGKHSRARLTDRSIRWHEKVFALLQVYSGFFGQI